jgi:DNA-binding response OmpR family regulator
MITGYATIKSAVEAIQKGAYDYIPKPFTPNELRTRVNRGLERRSLLLEAKKLREERERNLLELANEKSRTQTIIHCMADGLLVTNREEQVVFCNPAGRPYGTRHSVSSLFTNPACRLMMPRCSRRAAGY